MDRHYDTNPQGKCFPWGSQYFCLKEDSDSEHLDSLPPARSRWTHVQKVSKCAVGGYKLSLLALKMVDLISKLRNFSKLDKQEIGAWRQNDQVCFKHRESWKDGKLLVLFKRNGLHVNTGFVAVLWKKKCLFCFPRLFFPTSEIVWTHMGFFYIKTSTNMNNRTDGPYVSRVRNGSFFFSHPPMSLPPDCVSSLGWLIRLVFADEIVYQFNYRIDDWLLFLFSFKKKSVTKRMTIFFFFLLQDLPPQTSKLGLIWNI